MPGKHRGPPGTEPTLLVVPSGNLGNLTAGLLAKRMGAPLGRFLAATNRNDGFARFLASGRAEARHAVRTPSSAMDVGNPSNLPRIRALYDGNRRALQHDVVAASIDDESTLTCMRRVFEEQGRFICPHTAVGIAALRMHRFQTGDHSPALVLATAHPGKFEEVVMQATGRTPPRPASFGALERARRPPRRLRPDPAALVSVLRRLG
jgi:threonine synthase